VISAGVDTPVSLLLIFDCFLWRVVFSKTQVCTRFLSASCALIAMSRFDVLRCLLVFNLVLFQHSIGATSTHAASIIEPALAGASR
jgi:hypothetical protein